MNVMTFSGLLKDWRKQRGFSQLALSLEADISSRHLSFLETGRARPSEAMVLRLADALRVPLRETNAFLNAAGYVGRYADGALDRDELAEIRQALDLILNAHEPYPAFVVDRALNIVRANDGLGRFLAALGAAPAADGPPNIARAVLAPGPLREAIVNWDDVALALIARLKNEAWLEGPASPRRALLDEVKGDPAVAALMASGRPAVAGPILAVELVLAGRATAWFSTITTFGTPQDLAVAELAIEQMHPADTATAEAVAALGG